MRFESDLSPGCGVFQRYFNDQDEEHDPYKEERYQPLDMNRVERNINATAQSIDSNTEKGKEPDS